MFKRLRIALLLYLLLFVSAAQYFTSRRSTDWDTQHWVDGYTLAGDADPATRRYLDEIGEAEFAAVEQFLAQEAKRYGVALDAPFKIRVVGEHRDALPKLEPGDDALDVLVWSLRMRWLARRLQWEKEGPAGDIVVFAVFHEPDGGSALDRSTALHKGLIAVANLFAARTAQGTNEIVLAHELLHTLKATDKYSLSSNQPAYPDGYAAPDAQPRLPQSKAELMAGRIPVADGLSEIPFDLRDVVIGPATAREIGWQERRQP